MAANGRRADRNLGDVTSMSLASLRTLDDKQLQAALAQACGGATDTDERWGLDRVRNDGRTRRLGDALPL